MLTKHPIVTCVNNRIVIFLEPENRREITAPGEITIVHRGFVENLETSVIRKRPNSDKNRAQKSIAFSTVDVCRVSNTHQLHG